MTSSVKHDLNTDVDAPIALTPREQQVLLWCAYGKTSWEIGQILECKESTVNFHVGNILRKFAVTTRVAAVIKALRYGLLSDQ
ncbi:helix-turn-helix transcriptional regulator [Pseudomonas capeferrum]|uniref:helix-turn-helix domain-containing protein n=1 Tax=Pseudomonas capeferrum TaxID=1495066 RepID=UPI0015E46FF8|nr:helix-turn-helix transcriptional regulator [Pseudomonas capeferrum]MBA1205226.1 helix-turn-helix transcriptional regulator [Pseudomonas capeferrum]